MKKNQIILSIFPFVGSFFFGMHVCTLNRRNFVKVFISLFITLITFMILLFFASFLPEKLFNDSNVYLIYIIILGIIFNILFCLLYNYFERKEKKNNDSRKKSIRNRTRF